MKLYGYICLTLCMYLNVCAASDFPNKFQMNCDAATFYIQSDLSKPLIKGHVRSVNAFLASFVDSDGYSTRETRECVKGDDGKKTCLLTSNNVFCKNPLPSFKVKSITSDNSKVMVKNRCDNGYTKFIKISKDNAKIVYMEDRMHFKIKNQIHETEDYSSYQKPVLIFTKQDEDVILTIESLSYNHLTEDFSNQAKLNLGLSSYQATVLPSDRYELWTTCKNND